MPLFPFKPRPRPPADLPAPKIRAAIPRLERLLAAFHEVDLDDWSGWPVFGLGMELEELLDRLEDSLAGVFGRDSREYHRLMGKLERSKPSFEWGSNYAAIEGCETTLRCAIRTLRTAIRYLYWKLDRKGAPPQDLAI